MKLSKPIIDEIDKVLAKHYGLDTFGCASAILSKLNDARLAQSFTDEELDFIIRSALPLCSAKNYDIKYRMGDELNEE